MNTIEQLEAQRISILKQFADIGEFRPGSLSRNYRKFGNPSCRCANDNNPGHSGWQLSRKVNAKSVNRSIPSYALDATQQQLEQYQQFMNLVRQYTEVNESLCDLRLKSKRSKNKTARNTN